MPTDLRAKVMGRIDLIRSGQAVPAGGRDRDGAARSDVDVSGAAPAEESGPSTTAGKKPA